MIVDLHAHYPMHLVPVWKRVPRRIAQAAGPDPGLRDWLRGLFMQLASAFFNYRDLFSGPGVTVRRMLEGGVGVAFSVAYSPFDEMDLSKPYAAPPDPGYFPTLARRLDEVEERIANLHGGRARVVTNRRMLDAALAERRLALVHCVEGGFHLGATEQRVAENVRVLAGRGVAYVTLAHLFFRQIATNAPAIPFLSDAQYRRNWPQPDLGLTELGRAAVRAMVANGVLVDATHMSPRAHEELFALIDEIDPERRVPVIASHMACRFGTFEYDLPDDVIRRIGERRGVLGIIFCDHLVRDGLLPRKTRKFAQSVQLVLQHVRRIERVTGSMDHAAIGSDLDGFIKPTLRGLEHMGRMAALEAALVRELGEAEARKIASENALRVLKAVWA